MSHHGKLIACIGYSLRLAQKSGQTTTIDHLWHGLYSLTRQDEPVKQPLCLYTALGLDQDVVMNQHPTSSSCAQSATLALGGDLIPLQHCPHIHLSAAPARPTAQGCCNVATQTEVGMISMPDFEAFLARFTKDVEKRLFDNLKHLCAPCPAEPTSPTSSTTVSQAPWQTQALWWISNQSAHALSLALWPFVDRMRSASTRSLTNRRPTNWQELDETYTPRCFAYLCALTLLFCHGLAPALRIQSFLWVHDSALFQEIHVLVKFSSVSCNF
eukprot:Skav213015  [mRNA]  locus=scaffold2312:166882:167694:+ [translate_table: standard]